MIYALVTGSTQGIGKQIALDLLKQGCFVFLNYSNSEKNANDTRQELLKISTNFMIVKADLSVSDGINFLISEIKDKTHFIDYIVLNAAITNRTDFTLITRAEWDTVINMNLTAPFFLIQGLNEIISMGGRIVLIGALLGIVPHAISIPYGVSKAGLHMMAKYLVKVFADRKITVNVIAPGFIETPWQADKAPDHRKRIEEKIAMNRFGTVSEVSSTCLEIIKNGYINGQVIVVDGGYGYK